MEGHGNMTTTSWTRGVAMSKKVDHPSTDAWRFAKAATGQMRNGAPTYGLPGKGSIPEFKPPVEHVCAPEGHSPRFVGSTRGRPRDGSVASPSSTKFAKRVDAPEWEFVAPSVPMKPVGRVGAPEKLNLRFVGSSRGQPRGGGLWLLPLLRSP